MTDTLIPEDIMRAAASVWQAALRDGTPDAISIIARALQAERDAAVQIIIKAESEG